MNSFEQRLAKMLGVPRVTIDMDDDDMQFYVGPYNLSDADFKIYRVHSLVIADETTLQHGEPITLNVKEPG